MWTNKDQTRTKKDLTNVYFLIYLCGVSHKNCNFDIKHKEDAEALERL